jgi:hypothetical protein
MMKRGMTVLVLLVALVAIGFLIYREAMRGPTFRAEDHATYDECMQNIPREWLLGSLERTRAETACHVIHERRPRQQGS